MFLIAVVGWNIFCGYTGYISIGYAAFYGIGQYTGPNRDARPHPRRLGPVRPVPVAGIAAAVISVPLGLGPLRVLRQTSIVLTIAIMFIGQLLAFNWHDFTNGAQGLAVPVPPWQGAQLDQIFYDVTLGGALAAIATSVFIRRSKYGLSLLAIRDDEDRARGLGVRTMTAKLTAFVVSAFFVGIARAITPPSSASSPRSSPSIRPSTWFVVLAFACGLGTISGPILGCLRLEPLQQYFQLQFGASNVYLLVYGMLFVLTSDSCPQASCQR